SSCFWRSSSRSCRNRRTRFAPSSKARGRRRHQSHRRSCRLKRNPRLLRRPRQHAHPAIAGPNRAPAYVLLEDGAWFPGTAPLPFEPAYAEVVFTTNLSGYQEVFTDPSYLGQIVVMTAPMIGNYGINPDDIESDRPRVAGVVVRELSVQPSNWRSTGALAEWLAAARIPLVADVDTRQITRHIRSKGAMRGAVAIGEQPNDAVRTALAASPSMDGLDLATEATIGAEYTEGPADARRHIVAYDYGMKRNILRLFLKNACRVTVVPDARRGCGGRDDGDTAAVLEKQSQDVPLHPVVVRHDVATCVRRPFGVLGADGRLGREIETVHRGARGERGVHGVVRLLAYRHGAAH